MSKKGSSTTPNRRAPKLSVQQKKGIADAVTRAEAAGRAAETARREYKQARKAYRKARKAEKKARRELKALARRHGKSVVSKVGAGKPARKKRAAAPKRPPAPVEPPSMTSLSDSPFSEPTPS